MLWKSSSAAKDFWEMVTEWTLPSEGMVAGARISNRTGPEPETNSAPSRFVPPGSSEGTLATPQSTPAVAAGALISDVISALFLAVTTTASNRTGTSGGGVMPSEERAVESVNFTSFHASPLCCNT